MQQFDAFVPSLRRALGPADVAIVTADHGNDPTTPGTDHTREDVPLLVFGSTDRRLGRSLGVRPVTRLKLDQEEPSGSHRLDRPDREIGQQRRRLAPQGVSVILPRRNDYLPPSHNFAALANLSAMRRNIIMHKIL